MPLWFLRRNHAIFRWRDCNWFLPRHVKKTYYYKKPITIRWHSLGQVMPGRRFHQGVRLYCSYQSFASLTTFEERELKKDRISMWFSQYNSKSEV